MKQEQENINILWVVEYSFLFHFSYALSYAAYNAENNELNSEYGVFKKEIYEISQS